MEAVEAYRRTLELSPHLAEAHYNLGEALLDLGGLEEAGDALYENSDPTKWDLPEANARKLKEQEAWRKAKEAKL